MKRRVLALASVGVAIILLLGAMFWLIQRDGTAGEQGNATTAAGEAVQDEASASTNLSSPIEPRLPNEGSFARVAESDSLILWADAETGHFKAESKDSGNFWRSYPEPAYWEDEATSGVWRSNLLSPVMLEYIDASSSKSQTKLTNWMEERGVLAFEEMEDGFRATYHFNSTGFKIPVEVTLREDYVEVRIIDGGITEGALSLLNLKAYPMFGSQPSIDKEGYLLLPDGSGALARFEENRSNDKSVYREPVYGSDLAFYNEVTNRSEVKMPVFGLKSGKQSFLGVLTEGEEYAKLFAAPAGSLGNGNWITAEWQYRIKFFQSTDRRGVEGFYTFSKERFEAAERSVRYYLLEGEDVGYPAMAAKFRDYLIQERGLQRLPSGDGDIPFFADIVAADLKQGPLWDDYIVGTTTGEAERMLRELTDAGIGSITAIYHGWQRYGYSSHGGVLPADRRIGGNKGLESLANTAGELGGKLLLAANYSLNNSGRGGFWSLNDGLRNLAGTLLYQPLPAKEEDVPIVSPLYSFRKALGDLPEYEKLGVDGILFTGGIGSSLNTDFNSRNQATRSEVLDGQQAVLAATAETIGYAAAENASFYSLPGISHIHRIADDYSYDIFVDEAVPFAQIALHGLVTYTSEWGNLRDEYKSDYLKSVEYGAYPAYVFTAAASGAFKKAYSVWYYSMNYKDWIDVAAEQYERLNEALRDVQDAFIVDHATLAPGVKETVYENGHAVIVNYNAEPYQGDGYVVGASDFAIRKEDIRKEGKVYE
ncbi:DUF5696 domain-containing protein [Paenibacillus sp. PAMC21692]|uniref:DUF5696 domain-containing protein n=1 Tax=Paenibacillus sp. PAMC21692 TaxID=2762320 RepID=UPI00164E3582|nr:DUF5696 domain-containing protein [Paenibacillus sp. PAMC21692]QNK56276.1 hypothetical protein H7F31_27595 [Paenibacillus sp. PAMC21692]